MSLTLLLQCSNGAPVMGLARDGAVVWSSRDIAAFDESRDYRAMLEAGLAALSARVSDLGRLACDIGPGGLGATRTGAAFVNALGYALALPVVGLPAFACLGETLAEKGASRVVILRKAARPFVHFGIFENGKIIRSEHFERSEALSTLQNLNDYDIAGNLALEGLPAPVTNEASLSALLRVLDTCPEPADGARAIPLVEVLS